MEYRVLKKIKWDADLEIGVPPIDRQHRRIVVYINQLLSLGNHIDRDEVYSVLIQLVDYTVSHFAFEEELMEECGYPFTKAHKLVHKLFIRKVGSYVERFEQGEDITKELLITLKTWLVNHIKNDDKDFSSIVRKKMNIRKKEGWFSSFIHRVLSRHNYG